MDKRCNCCGVYFDPSLHGVVGAINGQEVAICGPCCSGDYGDEKEKLCH